MTTKEFLKGFTPYRAEDSQYYEMAGAWENLTYGDLLDRAAAQNPQGTAVVDGRTRLTYLELKGGVYRLALEFLRLGIRPHDCIILQLPNRHEFALAFYAMQKIGAIPVLAVPRHGYREVSTFFRLTEAVGWVVAEKYGSTEFEPMIKKVRAEFKCLKHLILPEESEIFQDSLSMDRLIGNIQTEELSRIDLSEYRPDPNDVAVLIPTGGTTGLPKMVPRTHNSLIVTNRHISMGIDPSDNLLQATPVGHAMAMQGSVNCAMYRAATLVLEDVPRPTEILETIQREKVTRAFLVPTQLEGIIHHPHLHRYDLSSVKIVGTTGAALSRETAQEAADYFTNLGAKFSGNALGASEGLLTTGDPDAPLDEQLKTVGRNLTPGSHYKVIDEQGRELPEEEQGELVAKGPEVFTGYYKASEEENRDIFTSDGYYRTGDLARIDEQGNIMITGRKKDVIIRGGETLVPGQMEDLIRKHPHVEAVSVVGMPDPKMGERACAYVVVKEGKGFTFEEMIEFLKSQGAGVLLFPERLEIISALPKTSVGKIDKKALRSDIASMLRREGTFPIRS